MLVLDGGFEWQGRTWRSLSEIAREITGARWSGPRLFGFLAPYIVEAIVKGEQPISLTAKWRLKNNALTRSWLDQKDVLGFF